MLDSALLALARSRAALQSALAALPPWNAEALLCQRVDHRAALVDIRLRCGWFGMLPRARCFVRLTIGNLQRRRKLARGQCRFELRFLCECRRREEKRQRANRQRRDS